MVMCWAPGCNHYNIRESCRFYKFPTDNKLRNKWIQLISRQGDAEPGLHARLCSCHFPNGKRENTPTFSENNKEQLLTCSSPKIKKERGIIPEATSDTSFVFSPPEIKKEPGITEDVIRIPTKMEVPVHKSVRQQPLVDVSGPSTSGICRGPSTSPSAAVVEAENYFLQKRIAELEKESRGGALTFKHIEENYSLCRLYTGLHSAKNFLALHGLLENIPINYYYSWKVEKMSKMDQLLMCLMKLRQNYPHEDLALRFKVSQATVTNIVITWVHVLHNILFKQLMGSTSCLRSCFKTFTYFRLIVIDSTEITMTVPRRSKLCQKSTSSSNKHTNIWKALIGVAPNGVITFVSTLYPGSWSDKNIVQHCGVMENLKPGDFILADEGFLLTDLLPAGVNLNVPRFLVMENIMENFETGDFIMADKGFLLNDLLPPGVNLNEPTFLETGQLTLSQVKQAEGIARASVEKAIQRMRQYRIINFMTRSLFEHAGVILQVVSSLTNLNNTQLIK